MTTDQTPIAPGDLPTSQQLLRSTGIAALVAGVLLVTVVLPAEYGLDPTGVGHLLGLKAMGDVKVRLAGGGEAPTTAPPSPVEASPPVPPPPVEASPPAPPPPVEAPVPAAVATTATTTPPVKSDVTLITLQPNEGKEVKLSMRQGARATYSWSTDRGVVNFDLHTDKADGSVHSYRKAKGAAVDEGELVAVSDGLHGWFWRNRTTEVVTITLRTGGDYLEVKVLK